MVLLVDSSFFLSEHQIYHVCDVCVTEIWYFVQGQEKLRMEPADTTPEPHPYKRE